MNGPTRKKSPNIQSHSQRQSTGQPHGNSSTGKKGEKKVSRGVKNAKLPLPPVGTAIAGVFYDEKGHHSKQIVEHHHEPYRKYEK